MRVRIIRDIPTPRLEGFEVHEYQNGGVYEIGRSLCEVLFAYEYAVPEEGIAATVTSIPQRADDRPVSKRRKGRVR